MFCIHAVKMKQKILIYLLISLLLIPQIPFFFEREPVNADTNWYAFGKNQTHMGYTTTDFAPINNTLLWTANTTGDYDQFQGAIIVDGIVYTQGKGSNTGISGTNKTYALYLTNGTEIWNFTSGPSDSVPTYDTTYDCVYVQTQGKVESDGPYKLWCLYASNGTEKWNVITEGEGIGSQTHPILDEENNLVITATNGLAYGVYRNNGTTKWTQDVHDNWQIVHGLTYFNHSTFGGIFILHSVTNGIECYYSNNGTLIWANSSSVYDGWDSCPICTIIDGQEVFIHAKYTGGSTQVIVCGNITTGEEIWRWTRTTSVNRGGLFSISYHDEKAYVGGKNDTVYCINCTIESPPPDRMIWSTVLSGDVYSQPIIANGFIYVGSRGQPNLFCLWENNGTERWNYTMGSGVDCPSQPAISDGILVVGCDDWNTYAFITPVRVSGYIKNAEGAAMGGLSVNITNNNTGDYAVATSDINGFYTREIIAFDGNILFGNCTAGLGIGGTNQTAANRSNVTQWLNITVTSGVSADFSWTPLNPIAGDNVAFIDKSLGDITIWTWKFGDGSTSVGRNQVHTYDNPGSYKVTLKIVNAIGNSDICSRSVSVLDLEEPYIPIPADPVEPEGYNVSDAYNILKVSDLSVSNNKITVVVIDTGFTPTVYEGVDMRGIEGYALPGFENIYDDNGHGTFTIYEVMYITQNKCPNANIISYKTFDEYGSATPTDFLDALDAVKYMRPDIVSISAGAIGNPLDGYSMKIKEMREDGIIVVASAAGNLGPTLGTILSPACSDYAIAVGAFDTKGTLTLADDEICSWSSRGPVPDISPKPDVVAPGESILGPWLYSVKSASGTSMSAPLIVGGTAAVIAQNKPLLDIVRAMYFWNLVVIGDAYEEALKDSCTAVGDKDAWGAGVPDFIKVNDNFRNRLLLLIIIPIAVIILIAIIATIFFYKRNVESTLF